MKHLIFVLLIGTTWQGYSGTFDLDTIENWQIYNGVDLVLAGAYSPLGTVFQGSIKRTELKDLTVQFNRDSYPVELYDVTIDIVNEHGKIILTGKFKAHQGVRFAFRKKQIEELVGAVITIKYREERKNGRVCVLGEIRFE